MSDRDESPTRSGFTWKISWKVRWVEYGGKTKQIFKYRKDADAKVAQLKVGCWLEQHNDDDDPGTDIWTCQTRTIWVKPVRILTTEKK